MKISLLLLLVVTTAISVDQTHSVSPGLQIRLTKKGLEYGNSVAQRYLSKLLNELTVPNVSGNKGNIHYKLSGIRNKRVKVPTSRLAFAPSHNGLSWSLTGLDIDVYAKWEVRYKSGWFSIGTSGGVDVELRRTSIHVTINVVQSGGRPQVDFRKCQMSVGSVGVVFHGGTAFILNLFKGIVSDKLKDLMEDRVCDLLKGVVNSKANEKLKDLKVDVALDRFLLDYSLVRNPKVQSGSLETYHKGEVFWKKDKKHSPILPRTIPPFSDQSRMVYLWVTDYMAKTALATAQSHGYLAYNITKKDFPGNYQTYLNATCKDICIGKIISQIGIKFPHNEVLLGVASHETPTVTIAPSGITAAVKANLVLNAFNPADKSVHELVELRAEVTASIVGSLTDARITGRITSQTLNFIVTKSPIGKLDTPEITKALNVILEYAVVPYANVILKKGVDIPLTGIIDFDNAQIILQDGVAVIATDVNYKGNFGK